MADTQVAVVTGGAQGLGSAICEVLLEEGYKVCVADVQKEKGEELARDLNKKYGRGKAHFAFCDVSDEENYRDTLNITKDEFGSLTLLVNNAGILDEKNRQRMINVNLVGSVNGCQIALDVMGKSKGGKGGTVLLVASIAGTAPCAVLPVYSATKHGVVGLARSFGTPHYLDKDDVAFMALCPSFIDTDMIPRWETHSAIDDFKFDSSPTLMDPRYVAEAALSLIKERRNGSVLVVSKKPGNFYIKMQDDLKEALRH